MSLKHLLTNLFKGKEKEEKEEFEPSPEVEVEKVEKKLSFGNQGVGSTWKCSEQDKQLIVAWYAAGFTQHEIVEKAKEELSLDISAHQIRNYYTADKWKPVIKKIRESTMNDIAAVAGSHKRVRLERHERIYDKAIKRGKLKDAIVATVEQRKEMEGDGSMNVSFNQFNVMNDDELEIRKKETLDKIKLISEYKGGNNESTVKTITVGAEGIEKT